MRKSGLDIKVIGQILAGSGDITSDISEKLGIALELGKGFFSRMKSIYEDNIADLSDDSEIYDIEDIEKIDKSSVILSALSAGDFGTIYNSVHIQKLLFPINEKIAVKKNV